MTAALENRRLKYAVEACANGVWGDEPNGEDDLVVVRVADFDREKGVVSLGDAPTVRAIPESARNRRVLAPGDLLLEKSGGGEQQPVGNVVLFRDTCPAVCSNFVARMPVKAGCDSRYVAYVFRSLYAEGRNIPHIKQTSGIQNLDSESYLNEVAWLPPKPDQERIANFLDEQTARIDALIAEKEGLCRLLDELLDAETTSLVCEGTSRHLSMARGSVPWLPQYPAHWRMASLKQVVDVRDGTHETPSYVDYEEGSYPLVTSKDVASGHLRFEQTKRISKPDYEEISRRSNVRKGDLLMPMIGTVGGAVEVDTDEPFAIKNLALFKPVPSVCNRKWLKAILNSSYVRTQFDFMRSGGVQGFVALGELRNMRVPLPPPHEQVEIAESVFLLGQRLQPLITHARAHIDRLREYRSSLISAAVTGQLDLSTFKAAA